LRDETPNQSSNPYMDDPDAGASGPCGLLQGSPASNVILAWLLRDLGDHVDGNCRLFVFADNFILVARDMASCRRNVDTLTSHLGRECIGPLVLHGEFHQPGWSFEALGYGFWYDALSGRWQVDFSRANVEKIFGRMKDAIAHDLEAGRVEPVELERVARRAITGFRAVTNADKFVEVQIELARDDLAKNECELRGQLRESLSDTVSDDDVEALIGLIRTRERVLYRSQTTAGRCNRLPEIRGNAPI